MRVLSAIKDSGGLLQGIDAVKLIGDQFLCHPMKIISDKSVQVLGGLLNNIQLTESEANDIIETYPSIKDK